MFVVEFFYLFFRVAEKKYSIRTFKTSGEASGPPGVNRGWKAESCCTSMLGSLYVGHVYYNRVEFKRGH